MLRVGSTSVGAARRLLNVRFRTLLQQRITNLCTNFADLDKVE